MANKKVIKIELTQESIDNAIREIEEYKTWLEECTEKFIQRLGEEGCTIAQSRFDNSLVSGVNDVEVSVEGKGARCCVVTALGTATWFIEFGTGVVQFDNHPERGKVPGRGTYGKGQGNNPKGWLYRGPAGTEGEPSTVKPGLMHTYGDPANMPMYLTVQDLKNRVKDIAEECFK